MPKARDHVQSVQRFFQVMRWHQAKRDAARMFRSKLMENSGALLLVPLELSPVISSIGLAPLSELLAEPALCSGNKKQTKNNKNAAFHSHRSAAFLSVVFSLLAVAIATPLSGRYASVIGRAAHATLRS